MKNIGYNKIHEIYEVNLEDMNKAVPYMAGIIKELSEQGENTFVFKFKDPLMKDIHALNTMLIEANYFTTCLFEKVNDILWYYIQVQIKR